MPMSTTWVFLGVLAGREFALSVYLADTSAKGTARQVGLRCAEGAVGGSWSASRWPSGCRGSTRWRSVDASPRSSESPY